MYRVASADLMRETGLLWSQGDLEHLPPDLFPTSPHVVVHLATKQIDRDGSSFQRTNEQGTATLLRSLPSSTRAVIYGSSMSVYGQGPQFDIRENAPLQPETALAQSRLNTERLILDHAGRRAITGYCLRPRMILGQGDRYTVDGLLRMMERGVAPGNGHQRFSLIDVDDYAGAIMDLARRALLLDQRTPPEQCALNVAYRESVSLDNLTAVISRVRGVALPRVHLPVPFALTRLLRRGPRAFAGLATRIELFGMTHTMNVDAICSRIGEPRFQRDPLEVIRLAAANGTEMAQPAPAVAQ